MTEADWLECADPTLMLRRSSAWRSPRKSRLFAVACCGRVGKLMTRDGSRAVATAELFADGAISQNELQRACEAVWYPWRRSRQCAADAARETSDPTAYHTATDAALWAVDAAIAAGWRADENRVRRNEQTAQADLIRDIFGNPFCGLILDSSWLTSTAVSLAEGIYADRAFDRLPILADALQDAGCEDEQVLAHCRGPGPHVRGCWVVDLVTGRG
jgi:hypothetical protein